MFDRFLRSEPGAAWNALPLIRLMVGSAFLSEGIQKFLYPALRGPGRFQKIGFPAPAFWGYLVGGFETACGLLILLGLFTCLAAIPTAVIMAVAIVTTKIPVLLGHGFGPFGVRAAAHYGFLAMAHEMRTDWAMLLGSLVLILAGGGPWALDRRIASKSITLEDTESTEGTARPSKGDVTVV